MVFRRGVESNVIKAENCKVAVYTCPVDQVQTETKGTVLIKTAKELTDFSRGEEQLLEKQIKAIADSGAKVGVMSIYLREKQKKMLISTLETAYIVAICPR